MGFPSTCKTHDMARLLGVSDRRVRQLVEEKVLVQKARDTFEVAANVHAYVSFRENAASSEAGRHHGLSRERAEMVKTQRALAEIELDERRGRVVEIDDAKEIIGRCLVTVKNKLLGLGAKIAPVANPGQPLLAQQAIYDGVIEALEELSTLENYGHTEQLELAVQ